MDAGDIKHLEEELEAVASLDTVDDDYPPDLSSEAEALIEIPSKSNRGRQVISREKERRAMELRKAGATYQQIADQIGWSDGSSARQAVLRGLKRLGDEAAEDLRSLQYQRLNEMLLVTWPQVQTGDTDAIRTAQGLMRDMNQLFGVEAPSKLEVEHVEKAVLVIGGDKDSYIANIQKAMGIVDESEAKELMSGDVVDAEIVEDD